MKNKKTITEHSDTIALIVIVSFVLWLISICHIVLNCSTRWQDKSALALQDQGYVRCEIKETNKPLITIAGINNEELNKYNNQTDTLISVMKIRVNGEISEVKIPIDQIKELKKK